MYIYPNTRYSTSTLIRKLNFGFGSLHILNCILGQGYPYTEIENNDAIFSGSTLNTKKQSSIIMLCLSYSKSEVSENEVVKKKSGGTFFDLRKFVF